jgi:hypothetical protein
MPFTPIDAATRVVALALALIFAACQSTQPTSEPTITGPPAPTPTPTRPPTNAPTNVPSSPSPEPSPEPTLPDYAGAEAVIPVASGPRGVAWIDGHIWVASTRGDLVQKVDPATNEIVAEISVGRRPVTLVTLDDRLWVSVLNGEPENDDRVVRIDPATSAVELEVTVPVHHNIAAGAGAIWALDTSGQLRRVDPASGEVTEETGSGAAPVALAANDAAVFGIRGDRMVWRHEIGTDELLEAPLPVSVPGRSRVAATDGGVWVAVPGLVLSLDPDSLAVWAELALPGMSLVNDLYVTGSDVWLSANVSSEDLGLDGGSILQLDPNDLEIRQTFRLGPESSGVVEAEGMLWAVDQAEHRLARFNLQAAGLQ